MTVDLAEFKKKKLYKHVLVAVWSFLELIDS